MLRKLVIAAGGVLAALAMATPAMASPAAHAAPAAPQSSGYCVVNGYGWYITSNGAGKEMTADSSCTTDIAWREQSNGSYEMAVNNGSSCANEGSNEVAYDNSCVANDSTEEFLVKEQSDGRYLLENVHYGLNLYGLGEGTVLSLSSADTPYAEWTW